MNVLFHVIVFLPPFTCLLISKMCLSLLECSGCLCLKPLAPRCSLCMCELAMPGMVFKFSWGSSISGPSLHSPRFPTSIHPSGTTAHKALTCSSTSFHSDLSYGFAPSYPRLLAFSFTSSSHRVHGVLF